MSDFDLDGYLAAERLLVEAALARASDEFDEMLPPELAAAARHGVVSGGKRLRPILCATAYRACGGAAPSDELYDFAISVELIHGRWRGGSR